MVVCVGVHGGDGGRLVSDSALVDVTVTENREDGVGVSGGGVRQSDEPGSSFVHKVSVRGLRVTSVSVLPCTCDSVILFCLPQIVFV